MRDLSLLAAAQVRLELRHVRVGPRLRPDALRALVRVCCGAAQEGGPGVGGAAEGEDGGRVEEREELRDGRGRGSQRAGRNGQYA